jgi:hypothetical protein
VLASLFLLSIGTLHGPGNLDRFTLPGCY